MPLSLPLALVVDSAPLGRVVAWSLIKRQDALLPIVIGLVLFTARTTMARKVIVRPAGRLFGQDTIRQISIQQSHTKLINNCRF